MVPFLGHNNPNQCFIIFNNLQLNFLDKILRQSLHPVQSRVTLNQKNTALLFLVLGTCQDKYYSLHMSIVLTFPFYLYSIFRIDTQVMLLQQTQTHTTHSHVYTHMHSDTRLNLGHRQQTHVTQHTDAEENMWRVLNLHQLCKQTDPKNTGRDGWGWLCFDLLDHIKSIAELNKEIQIIISPSCLQETGHHVARFPVASSCLSVQLIEQNSIVQSQRSLFMVLIL